MKIKTGLAIGTLATFALMSPSFAIEPGPPPKTAKETAPPAKKPSRFVLPHHVTGNVVAVNRSAQTFTVKGADGTLVTLTADAGVAPHLKDLKKRDRVKVTYKNSQGQQIATKLIPA
jgi:hypothetical protein